MQCPKCGTENPAGKIVCRACGARLRTPVAAAPASPVPIESDEELGRRLRYDLWRIVWVVGTVVGVGLVLGFLLK